MNDLFVNPSSSVPVIEQEDEYTVTTTTTQARDSRFCCNICLEAVREPVVTRCGHLYCWPCLYRWLEPGMLPNERRSLEVTFPLRQLSIDESRRVCPVCKALCSVLTLIPIYVRNPEEPISPSSPQTKSPCGADSNNNSIRSNRTKEENENNDLHEVDTPTISNVVVEDIDDIDGIDGIDEIDEIDASPISTTGLRHRRRHRASNMERRNEMERLVPARPTPPPPTTATENNEGDNSRNNNAVWRSSAIHRASLSNGLTLSVQQALLSGMGGMTAANDEGTIPSIHRRSGQASSSSANHATSEMETDPDSTEFLSRLLLMLGSFVIFCLLLF